MPTISKTPTVADARKLMVHSLYESNQEGETNPHALVDMALVALEAEGFEIVYIGGA